MSDAWITILALSATAALIRASGPVLFGRGELGGWRESVIPLLAPALLAALVVTETVGTADGIALDERLAGVAAAALILLRRPQLLLPAIAAAALTTAALRLVL